MELYLYSLNTPSRRGAQLKNTGTTLPLPLQVSESIVDALFPDGSKRLARNWCRNPGEERDEPWCYTKSKKIIDDYCDVPLCRYHGKNYKHQSTRLK
jgi:hypothetical protein